MKRFATCLLILIAFPVVAATGQTAHIQFVNAAADSELPAVDIYINGVLEVDALPFAAATPFMDVPADEPMDFVLTAAGGDVNTPLDAFATFGYASDSHRYLVVSGMLRPDRLWFATDRDLSLGFHVTTVRETPQNSGWFGIQLFQAAADMPALDWHVYDGPCAPSNYVGTAWEDVDYGQFSEYIESPPIAGYGVIADTMATEDDECAEWATWLQVHGDFTHMADEVLLNVLMGWVVPEAGEDSLKLVLIGPDGSVEDHPVTIFDRLVEVVTEGSSDTESDGELPATARLLGNYPNPFNPSTTIAYEVGTPSQVRLEVFDLLGRTVDRVVDEFVTAGIHEATWIAPPDAATGLYVARLSAGSTVVTRPMLLMK